MKARASEPPTSTSQFCPICSRPVPYYPRYPRYVCVECASRASSAQGRQLDFFNETLTGGFAAAYLDTGEPYPGHECYIDGIRCRADEAYMGGIVIQVVDGAGRPSMQFTRDS